MAALQMHSPEYLRLSSTVNTQTRIPKLALLLTQLRNMSSNPFPFQYVKRFDWGRQTKLRFHSQTLRNQTDS